MSTHPLARQEPVAGITLGLLDRLLGGLDVKNVGVRLWDGTPWPDENPRRVTLALKHPGALRAMLISGNELGLAESYIYDDFDVEGDFAAVFELSDALERATGGWRGRLAVAKDLFYLPTHTRRPCQARGPARLCGKRHSIVRDREAISFHYDVPADFYSLWLDRGMVYSCAYFTSEEDGLEKAQEQKLDYICRKLRLGQGQRFLDIGCGWGALVLHAARNYCVDATGITLSRPQAELANRRIEEAGLAENCRVIVCDYREMDGEGGYDAVSSVGMFEHVGEEMLPGYFARVLRLLRPGGVLLNHGIARNPKRGRVTGPSFADTYVFPDGELVPISATLRAAEGLGFEVRDVESLREHYAMTLEHWARRLEKNHDEALRYVDETTYRVWRLMLHGYAHGFTTGGMNLYQSLLLRPGDAGRSGLPLTRLDWYRGRANKKY